MGSNVIVLCLALFSIVLNVGAKDVVVPTKEITWNMEYSGEAYYAVPSDSSSELMKEVSLHSITPRDEQTIFLTTELLGTVYHGMSAGPLSTLTTCYLSRQNSTAYQLYPVLGGNNTDPNIKYKEDCGFEMSNITMGHLGKWILSTEFTDETGENKSVRQPLFITIEEEVDMIPKDVVTGYEGENIFVEFSKIPGGYIEWCRLVGPEPFFAGRYHLAFGSNCSLTFEEAADDVSGLWTFRVDAEMTFIGRINVIVLPLPKVDTTPVDLQLGSSATLTFGPENATYCRATDPMGLVQATQNGPCSLRLPVVGQEHDGQWNVQLGLPGITKTRSYTYTVNVNAYNAVGAEDVAAPAKEFTFKTEYFGEAYYAVSSDSSSDLMEETLKSTIFLTTDFLGTAYYGISTSALSNPTTCNLERANGLFYQLYPALEGNITDPNIKYREDCGFEMSNVSMDQLGKWNLTTEFTDELGENKWVQPLIITVEEEVDMIPKGSVTVYEGGNVTIKFSKVLDGVITWCRIRGPEPFFGEELAGRAIHIVIENNCTITFNEADHDIDGLWTIKMTGEMTYVAKINIIVLPLPEVDTTPVELQLGSSASLNFGPEDATYCRATDPMGLVQVTQNGPCSLKLPVVDQEHDGQWNVQLGLPGVTNTRSYTYTVNVNAPNADLGEGDAVPRVQHYT